MFFILGSVFLFLGINKFLEEGIANSYEFLLLGSILFIPGSYHSFIAWMAFRQIEGYTFDQVAVFDEDFNNLDD